MLFAFLWHIISRKEFLLWWNEGIDLTWWYFSWASLWTLLWSSSMEVMDSRIPWHWMLPPGLTLTNYHQLDATRTQANSDAEPATKASLYNDCSIDTWSATATWKGTSVPSVARDSTTLSTWRDTLGHIQVKKQRLTHSLSLPDVVSRQKSNLSV